MIRGLSVIPIFVQLLYNEIENIQRVAAGVRSRVLGAYRHCFEASLCKNGIVNVFQILFSYASKQALGTGLA